ncbi:MAG: hypothetical protein ACREMO_04275 [Gemmatimonadales bacterium]
MKLTDIVLLVLAVFGPFILVVGMDFVLGIARKRKQAPTQGADVVDSL